MLEQNEAEERNSVAIGVGIGILIFVVGGIIIVIARRHRYGR